MASLRFEKIYQEALAIEAEEALEAGTIGYMTRMMVQATLPHKDPGNVPGWGRTNGNFSLAIQPGITHHDGKIVPIGLPYGTIPRVLLCWIVSEAVRTKERRLILGDSLSAWMRQLDMIPTGGRWGNIGRLREQMKRLFSASITCTYDGMDGWAFESVRVADGAQLWWSPKSPDQAAIWQSSVELSEKFFSEVRKHPIPIDMRALRVLRKSPLGLDIYCWLTYRMSYLRRPTTIPWEALAMQFGSDYHRIVDFRRNFLKQLNAVTVVYPEAWVSEGDTGLLLKPSKTHVSRLPPIRS